MVTITPDVPYFAATADCDWATAERIAADLGDEHLELVQRAAALAEAEALLEDMDDGWDSDSNYLSLVGMTPVAYIRYRDGTYECRGDEARRAAREELRAIIRALFGGE